MKWHWRSRRPNEDEMVEEIESHLAMAARDERERGAKPEAARHAALREFGNRTLVQEVTREMWPWSRLEQAWQDARYALRTMRRSPGFTAVVALLLALGIGANTAIFSLINFLMLRPLDVRDPVRLMELLKHYPGDPRLNFFSPGEYRHLRDHNEVFSGLLATSPSHLELRTEDGGTERVDAETITGNYFPLLGIRAAAGHLIGPEDDLPVAVMSWGHWKERYNLNPVIVGKRIRIKGALATIIGVAPPEFTGLLPWRPTRIWLSGGEGGAVVGRLRHGVSREHAESQVALLYWHAQKLAGDPLLGKVKIEAEPAWAGIALPVLRDRFANPLLALMAVAGLFLLLACANIAGMLLARTAARDREMALRVSLGAGRLRLVRQVLTESALLAVAGALGGIMLARFAIGVLLTVVASGRPIPGMPEDLRLSVPLDTRVMLFMIGLALLTGLLFGLAPALRAMTTMPARSLSAPQTAGAGKKGRKFRSTLVAGQVALTVVLLSLAGQLVEHLWQLRNSVGFERDRVVLVTLHPAGGGSKRERLTGVYRELLARLEVISGVESATLCGPTPVSGAGASRFVDVEGHSERAENRLYVSLAWIAPKYFQTLAIPLLAGRDFDFSDAGGSRVAIVNETMARYYFGENNPIGKHIRVDRDPRTGGWYGEDTPYEIVAVVADSKYSEPGETPRRILYLHAFQENRIQHNVALRTSGDQASVISAIRPLVRQEFPEVAVDRVIRLASQVDASLVPERLASVLAVTFSGLGAMIAAIGLYGLLAYTVTRRMGEMGIRMALGATRGEISRIVLGEAMKMTLAGLAVGIPAAWWAMQLAAGLISVPPMVSSAWVGFGVVAILAVALLAAYFPARRASRLDPIVVLRCE